MDRCGALQDLPESFGNLIASTALDRSFCRSLKLLPDSCDQLTALKVLWYEECPALERNAWSASLFAVMLWLTKALGRVHEVCSFCGCCDSIDQDAMQEYMWASYASLWHTDTKGYQVLNSAKQLRRRREQRAAATKLATQQDVMLTTLERMSWLVVLLATATFVAYMQPPGGTDDDSKQVMVSNVTSCFAPLQELEDKGMSSFMQCAMLLFFVFDRLSFGLSVGCLVLIVMLSMPRMQWQDEKAEAGRCYVLLLFTWLLLYLAVSFGFAAFIASGLAVRAQQWMVLGPVIPGMVLLLAGAVFFLHWFHTLNPGLAAVWAARPFCERELAPVEPVEPPPTDVELGQARFWREWPQYLAVDGGANIVRPAQQGRRMAQTVFMLVRLCPCWDSRLDTAAAASNRSSWMTLLLPPLETLVHGQDMSTCSAFRRQRRSRLCTAVGAVYCWCCCSGGDFLDSVVGKRVGR